MYINQSLQKLTFSCIFAVELLFIFNHQEWTHSQSTVGDLALQPSIVSVCTSTGGNGWHVENVHIDGYHESINIPCNTYWLDDFESALFPRSGRYFTLRVKTNATYIEADTDDNVYITLVDSTGEECPERHLSNSRTYSDPFELDK